MKMKSNVFGFNAKLALSVLAVFGTLFTSCYEKESVDVTTVPPAVYYVVGSITDGSNEQPITTATVTVDGTAVTLKNEAFKQKVTAAGAHTVTVSAEGYYDVTRTVYCVEVADGQTSTAVVAIALFTPASQPIIYPEQIETPSTTQIDAVKADLVTAFTPSTPPAGTTMGETTAVVNNDGTVTLTTPLTLTTSTVDPIQVTYSYKSGFELVNEPAVVTKAVTGRDEFIANVSKYLNLPFSLSEKTEKALLDGGGKSIIGFRVISNVNVKTFVFKILEESWSGDVTWMDNTRVEPIFDTHDSHDSHDNHGGTTNAGGGSAGSE